jgi:Bacterial tandem repeat domain 1
MLKTSARLAILALSLSIPVVNSHAVIAKGNLRAFVIPQNLTIAQASGAWVARHGLSGAQYQAEFDKLVGQGYKLTNVSGYSLGNQDRYAAIWEKPDNQNAWVARHGLSGAQYQAEFDKLVGQGYKLMQVSGYSIGGQDRYAAIWEKSGNQNAWVARHGLSSAQYQAEFDKLVGQGYKLMQVSGYNVGGQDRYAAIWEKSGNQNAWVARHGLSGAQYQAEFDKLVGQGYKLMQVSGYSVGNQGRLGRFGGGVVNQDRYAAIWEKSGNQNAWVARHGLSGAQYQAEFDKLVGQGYRLVQVSGYNVSGKDRYAAIWSK